MRPLARAGAAWTVAPPSSRTRRAPHAPRVPAPGRESLAPPASRYQRACPGLNRGRRGDTARGATDETQAFRMSVTKTPHVGQTVVSRIREATSMVYPLVQYVGPAHPNQAEVTPSKVAPKLNRDRIQLRWTAVSRSAGSEPSRGNGGAQPSRKRCENCDPQVVLTKPPSIT